MTARAIPIDAVTESTRKGRRVFSRLRRIMVISIFLGSAAFSVAVFTVATTCGFSGCPSEAEYRAAISGGVLLDASGNRFSAAVPGQQDIAPISRIPRNVRDAFVATEDRRFWTRNSTIDGRSLVRGLFRGQGFSTIPMQLARLTVVPPRLMKKSRAITVIRKIVEIRTAHRLIQIFKREEILAAYLGTVPLAGNTRGIEQASSALFGKTVSRLTLGQAALLAGSAKCPVCYDPRVNPKRARDRRNTVLRLMRNQQLISEGEFQSALRQPLGAHRKSGHLASTHSRSISRELDQICQALDCGDRRTITVQTTIDQRYQAAAVAVANKLATGTSRRFGFRLQVAILQIDAKTGAIRASVGGTRDQSLDRVSQMKRSIGSLFKFVTFAAAMEHDSTPESMVLDSPLHIVAGKGAWSPKNFDRRYSDSLVTLRHAFAASINIIAVRLGMQLSLPIVDEMATRLGLGGGIEYAADLLGTSEHTPLQVARSFAISTNCGKSIPVPFAIERIENADGDTLWMREAPPVNNILTATTCARMEELFRAVVDSGTAVSVRRSGLVGVPTILAKTGTSGGARDLWLATTVDGTTSVLWVGADTPRSLGNAVSAGPILGPAFAELYAREHR